MALKVKSFGNLDGQDVSLYTLQNKNGISVSLSNYGARIVAVNVPDKEGTFDNIVVGFNNVNKYIEQDTRQGAVVGRYANRIADATFILSDKVYTLFKNNNGNCLHGGEIGFDKKLWNVMILKDKIAPAVKFSYYSPDKEEGFPGNLWVDVIYELAEEDQLLMYFFASSDKETILNLTNHAYFNLKGVGEDILDHTLEIRADNYTVVDKFLIPTGEIAPVEGTPLDFRKAKKIGKEIMAALPGYDHNFVLNAERKYAAKLSEKRSGRVLEMNTTQPGLQVYTANHFDGNMVAANGKKVPQYGGVALETQHFPDSIHRANFPSVVLRPGERYEHKISYKFSVTG